jgi:hypothetical protein
MMLLGHRRAPNSEVDSEIVTLSHIRVLLTIVLINPILQDENSLDSSARTGPCDLDQ